MIEWFNENTVHRHFSTKTNVQAFNDILNVTTRSIAVSGGKVKITQSFSDLRSVTHPSTGCKTKSIDGWIEPVARWTRWAKNCRAADTCGRTFVYLSSCRVIAASIVRVLSQGGCGDALLQRIPPYLTWHIVSLCIWWAQQHLDTVQNPPYPFSELSPLILELPKF